MIPEEAINNDMQLASELADLCYNVGQQAFSKGQFDLAAKWLEKAAKHNSRSLNAGDENSPNVKLRLVILHMTGRPSTIDRAVPYFNLLITTVRAYLEQNSGESRTKSLQTLEILISVCSKFHAIRYNPSPNIV
jgi:meiosis protein SPO22/ZIP4